MHNVLVTGGSRGIGLGIAQRLAGAGYNVIAVSRRESDELRKAIEEAASDGGGRLHFRIGSFNRFGWHAPTYGPGP